MKYLSNFRSLEFGGTFYDHGEEITVRKGEEGAMNVLVREGRVTEVADSDASVPAGTAGGEGPGTAGFDADAFIGRNVSDISDDELANLTNEQRAAVRAAEEDREKPRRGLLDRL